jgi:SAM-dependent methyltransferase
MASDAEPAFEAIAPFYDRVMAGIPYPDWADYLELLLRHWRGSREYVLDLACGTGSVGLELALRGSRVVGLDRSRPMLQEARRKAARLDVPVRFCQQDLRAVGVDTAFDLAVCLFDSLNYLLELPSLQAAFHGVRRALPPGGLFIFDLNTPRALELELFTQPVKLRWQSRYSAKTRISEIRMEFFLDDGRTVTETHRERAYSPQEVRDALDAARWRILAVYDAYTFNLPQKRSERVFYVCRAG